MSSKPDFSFYLAHFTTDKEPWVKDDPANPTIEKTRGLSARDRLISILNERKILASSLPWKVGGRAVCLTECPWTSLLVHAKTYSPYGIGFNKALIYLLEGNPVFYVRDEVYNEQIWSPKAHVFVSRFLPSYRPGGKKDGKQPIDYLHEREWRVPKDLTFKYNQVEFVIVNKYEDIDKIPSNIREYIGLIHRMPEK